MTYDVKDCCLEYLSSERSRAERLRGGCAGGAPLVRELTHMFGRSFGKLVGTVLGTDGYTRLYQDRKEGWNEKR